MAPLTFIDTHNMVAFLSKSDASEGFDRIIDFLNAHTINMVRNVDSPSMFFMYRSFLQVVMDNQVDDMTTHNTRYTSPALTQKVFTNIRRVGKDFSGVETPLFASMLVQPQPQVEEAIDADEGITLVDVKTDKDVVALDAESQERLNQEYFNGTCKGVSAVSAPELVSVAKPTIFDDEDVTMTMA
nr:hypothetical protein [Tanacetum cinerariifolium]